MSSWEPWGNYAERRVRTAAVTASSPWGRRWTRALAELLHARGSVIAKARREAHAGREGELLVVREGRVTATVDGTGFAPYEVWLSVRPLTGLQWAALTTALVSRARFAAALLCGRMPEGIDEACAAAGASLFPDTRADFAYSCSCADPPPCMHVAALHLRIACALDADPVLLVELRGQDRRAFFSALRAERASAKHEPRPRSVDLSAADGRQYDAWRGSRPAMQALLDDFDS